MPDMTGKDIEAELHKDPFVPFRLHLVGGKMIDVPFPTVAWLLQNAVLVFQRPTAGSQRAEGYDVLALRNFERIEQVTRRRGNGSRK